MRDPYHKSSARMTADLAINDVVEKRNGDWYFPGATNPKVELAIPDCRALKVINSRRGRRKEFAIWYGNRELGPEASRQAASRLRYHNDKFQEEDSARNLGFAMLIFSISWIASHLPWDIADGERPVWILQKRMLITYLAAQMKI